MEQEMEFAVKKGGERLDRFLADQVPGASRAEVQRWIKEERASVDGRSAKASYKLAAGETVRLLRPPQVEAVVEPEAIPLSVVYEDEDLLVVDKPAGMVVHPAPGHSRGTLVNALLARNPGLAGVGGPERAGIVHRLDRDTSGLLVVAKTAEALQALQRQFRTRQVQKTYLALVEGIVDVPEGRIEAPIARDSAHRKRMAVVSERRGGRPAVTGFRVLGIYEPRLSTERQMYTLLELSLHTGRTHQIRVHLAFLKHPVVGDRVYGRRKQRIRCPRQFLHASRLVFTQPKTAVIIAVESVLPGDLQNILDEMVKRSPTEDLKW